jgi:hypothetical protein
LDPKPLLIDEKKPAPPPPSEMGDVTVSFGGTGFTGAGSTSTGEGESSSISFVIPFQAKSLKRFNPAVTLPVDATGGIGEVGRPWEESAPLATSWGVVVSSDGRPSLHHFRHKLHAAPNSLSVPPKELTSYSCSSLTATKKILPNLPGVSIPDGP